MSPLRTRMIEDMTLAGLALGTRCCMDPVLVAGERAGTHIGKPIHLRGTCALPFKYHAEHRHRIPKARYRVTNWPEYALR